MPSSADRILAGILARNPELRVDDSTAGDLMADVSRKVAGSPPVQREEQMQRDLFTWIRSEQGYAPELRWVMHVPNGGHRHPAVAGKMKAQGVRRGVPDVWVPVSKMDDHGNVFAGLIVELKVGRNQCTMQQRDWLGHMERNGWQVYVIYDDWRLAANEIARYLSYDELVQEIE